MCTCSCTVGKKQVPLSMAIEIWKVHFTNTRAWDPQE